MESKQNKNKFKRRTTNYLSSNNMTYAIIAVTFNYLLYLVFSSNRDTFVYSSIFANFLIFFLYRIKLIDLIKNYPYEIKKETYYVNYPKTIGIISLAFLTAILLNVPIFMGLQKNNYDFYFLSTFFFSTLFLFLPLIILIVYIYLIVPAFVIPMYNRDKKRSDKPFYIFLIFFIFVCIYQLIVGINSINFQHKTKYKAVKLFMKYSTKYLNFTDLSSETLTDLNKVSIEVPLLYTSKEYHFKDYEDANRFCKSLNTSVPNYLEVYNILLNRFDVWGEKYYWTSNYAGKTNLVIHFKNMKYEVIKNPGNVKVYAFCSSPMKSTSKIFYNKNFYKIQPVELEPENAKAQKKHFKLNQNKLFGGKKEADKLNLGAKLNTSSGKMPFENKKYDNAEAEMRNIAFSIKYIPTEYFNDYINNGYYYDSNIRLNNIYESSDNEIGKKIKRNGNNIRLCYFPFMEYNGLTQFNEKEIWRQSFCSPAFELINETPALKTKHEKDAYCMANGGRLPNIPELFGILETLKIPHQIGTSYWTNTSVSYNSERNPILVHYIDSNNVSVEQTNNSNNKAYTFCVKNSQRQSIVISNFKSKFADMDGNHYAKTICNDCRYYEMPDIMPIK